MAINGEEIRQRLQIFAAKWSVYEGSERSEAQTYCTELLRCYGTDRQDVAGFETAQAGGFVDMLWPEVCVIEMKAPRGANRLDKHRPQALDYWRNAADAAAGVPAPRYVILSAFRKMEIWEPGAYPNAPRVVMDLVDLPDRYDALLFLAGDEPVFIGGQVDVTRDAVSLITGLFASLRERRAEGSDVLRDFILQSVWCMFAEDLGLLPKHQFTRLVDGLIATPSRSSADDIGQLFRWLNDPASQRPSQGAYAGAPYANGGLFRQAAGVHLERAELDLLREACAYNWTQVQPQIFGSLLEGGLGHDKQWALGAHYTAEADIQKVIQPTIVRPWMERIQGLTTHKEALEAQADLTRYVVLDPACGSGNFLYVAYRELRRIEARLRDRESELRTKAGLQDQGTLAAFFPVSNLQGIDIDGFAIGLARVTIWIGHKLAVDELGISEATLPLADLSGICVGDALRMPWPRADAIIGNPPFHGSQKIRGVLGDDYVDWLKREFKAGIKDYCVYWFRKAHDHLPTGGRAGLVGTNSISQNRARGASLEYIVESGGVITDAVSKQPWPGAAFVNVSIVNWTKDPASAPRACMLDGQEVDGVNASLCAVGRTGETHVHRLAGNRRLAFQGPKPVGKGFVLMPRDAHELLALPNVASDGVLRPYITGHDLANTPSQTPTRFVIDFDQRTLEEANAYPELVAHLRQTVKHERATNSDKYAREHWWLHGRPVLAMRDAISKLNRYVVGTATGKRVLFCWCARTTCPSNVTNVFAFEDDYAMGVLASRIHGEWARAQSSTFGVGIRYTPTSAFATFAFPPAPTDAQREAVADACRAVFARRSEICITQQIGLTTLYNQVDDGAWADLKALHLALDQAVAEAYGWPKSIAQDVDETNSRLLALNAAITAGEIPYAPFA